VPAYELQRVSFVVPPTTAGSYFPRRQGDSLGPPAIVICAPWKRHPDRASVVPVALFIPFSPPLIAPWKVIPLFFSCRDRGIFSREYPRLRAKIAGAPELSRGYYRFT